MSRIYRDSLNHTRNVHGKVLPPMGLTRQKQISRAIERYQEILWCFSVEGLAQLSAQLHWAVGESSHSGNLPPPALQG